MEAREPPTLAALFFSSRHLKLRDPDALDRRFQRVRVAALNDLDIMLSRESAPQQEHRDGIGKHRP